MGFGTYRNHVDQLLDSKVSPVLRKRRKKHHKSLIQQKFKELWKGCFFLITKNMCVWEGSSSHSTCGFKPPFITIVPSKSPSKWLNQNTKFEREIYRYTRTQKGALLVLHHLADTSILWLSLPCSALKMLYPQDSTRRISSPAGFLEAQAVGATYRL